MYWNNMSAKTGLMH